jgi:hypothetical protein
VDGIRRARATRKSRHSPIEEQTTLHEEWALGKGKLVSGETEAMMGVKCVSAEPAYWSKVSRWLCCRLTVGVFITKL